MMVGYSGSCALEPLGDLDMRGDVDSGLKSHGPLGSCPFWSRRRGVLLSCKLHLRSPCNFVAVQEGAQTSHGSPKSPMNPKHVLG